MKANYTVIPQHLDEPERLLFWTVDEFIVLLMPIVFGFSIGVFWFGLVMGPLLCGCLIKIKRGGHVQLFLGHCYWHLPIAFLPFKALPHSYQRVWIG